MYEYTKGVLFRCKHAFCSLYFCGRKYCPKEEYFVTTIDGYLHKRVPLPGNTCQLETDITEHGNTLQYVTFEVAGFIKSYGTRRQGPSAPTANTNTLPRITIYCIYRVSQEECARLREGVPYVKVYRYNPKHLCPKLNGCGDNGQRKVWFSGGSMHCTCQLTSLIGVYP